jgi:hypothetical protein
VKDLIIDDYFREILKKVRGGEGEEDGGGRVSGKVTR